MNECSCMVECSTIAAKNKPYIIWRKFIMALSKEKQLLKWVKKLNRAKVAEAIDTDQDYDDLKEEFMDTLEELDDSGKIDDVDENVVKFFNALVEEDEGEEEGDEDDEDDKEEEEEEEEEDDEEEEEDDEEEEEDEEDEFAEMSRLEMKKFIKASKNKKVKAIKVFKSTSDDDLREAIREASGTKKAAPAKKATTKKATAKKTTTAKKKGSSEDGTTLHDLVAKSLTKHKGKSITFLKIRDEVVAERKKHGLSATPSMARLYVKIICSSLITLGFAAGDETSIKLKK